jgi:hypothetical protein
MEPVRGVSGARRRQSGRSRRLRSLAQPRGTSKGPSRSGALENPVPRDRHHLRGRKGRAPLRGPHAARCRARCRRAVLSSRKPAGRSERTFARLPPAALERPNAPVQDETERISEGLRQLRPHIPLRTHAARSIAPRFGGAPNTRSYSAGRRYPRAGRGPSLRAPRAGIRQTPNLSPSSVQPALHRVLPRRVLRRNLKCIPRQRVKCLRVRRVRGVDPVCARRVALLPNPCATIR